MLDELSVSLKYGESGLDIQHCDTNPNKAILSGLMLIGVKSEICVLSSNAASGETILFGFLSGLLCRCWTCMAARIT